MSTSDVMNGKLALFPDLAREALDTSRIEGMLPSQEIRELIASGHILSQPEITENQIHTASLDLRLGTISYPLPVSFLPHNSTAVQGIVDAFLRISMMDPTRTTVFPHGRDNIITLL